MKLLGLLSLFPCAVVGEIPNLLMICLCEVLRQNGYRPGMCLLEGSSLYPRYLFFDLLFKSLLVCKCVVKFILIKKGTPTSEDVTRSLCGLVQLSYASSARL